MGVSQPASLTREFAEHLAGLRFDALPPLAVDRSKTCLIDALGCVLAGVGSVEAATIRRALLADGGQGASAVLGTHQSFGAGAAALANGTAGHALDYDDSSPPMIGHPSVPILAASLAMAIPGRTSGADLVLAHIAGLEMAARLGRMLNPSHYGAGWHATATLGSFAATIAAAIIIGLDARQISHAIGIAASSMGGIRANFGSMVKPLHAGFAARNGVLAVQLAAQGFIANDCVLEAQNGFLEVFSGDLEACLATEKGELEIVRSGVGIKRYPCCGCTHSALDALLVLIGRDAPDAGAVQEITCTMNALVPDILIHQRPQTPAQAKFSMEYCLAVALLDGQCGLPQFQADRVVRRDVQDLLRRVRCIVDPAIPYENGVYPGTVTVFLQDGRRITKGAGKAVGHPDLPISAADLEHKFLDCAGRVLEPDKAAQSFEWLARLEDQRSLADLLPLVSP